MVREIPLTKGHIAVIDDADFERVNALKWCATERRRPDGSIRVYGYRRAARGQHKYLHRFILDAPSGVQVDHKDGNGLNNRRSNLRLASHSGNVRNVPKRSNNTSGYKGVRRMNGGFQAYIRVQAKQHCLGTFSDPAFAAAVYDAAARHLFGPFANTNFDIPNPEAEAIIAARFAERMAA